MGTCTGRNGDDVPIHAKRGTMATNGLALDNQPDCDGGIGGRRGVDYIKTRYTAIRYDVTK